MGLSTVFDNAVVTAFDVFKEAIKQGRYVVNPVESGWEEGETSVKHEMGVILNGLSQKDRENTSFSSQIQPNDSIIMVKGTDIRDNSIRVTNSDSFELDLAFGTDSFTIVAHDTDPYEALFLILLRERARNISPVIEDPEDPEDPVIEDP